MSLCPARFWSVLTVFSSFYGRVDSWKSELLYIYIFFFTSCDCISNFFKWLSASIGMRKWLFGLSNFSDKLLNRFSDIESGWVARASYSTSLYFQMGNMKVCFLMIFNCFWVLERNLNSICCVVNSWCSQYFAFKNQGHNPPSYDTLLLNILLCSIC
jgi:hypothetical protein